VQCYLLVKRNVEKDLEKNKNAILIYDKHTDNKYFLRGKGVILNVSSGIAKIPCPLYTLYSASKVKTSTQS